MADFENLISESEASDDDSSETSSIVVSNKKSSNKMVAGDPYDDDVEMSDVDEETDKEDDDNEDVDEDMDADGEELNDVDKNRELQAHFPEIEDDDDEEDEEDEDYLKKFDESLQTNIIRDHHPELQVHNYEEIDALCTIVRDEKGNIVDPFHRTLPIVTRYERARILGERAKQIDGGAPIFVEVEESMIDAYLIALKEFEAKKIPFILQRPLPNGACEYWRLSDLQIL
jgi:DNA-directed RNA polymerase subunit K/omega